MSAATGGSRRIRPGRALAVTVTAGLVCAVPGLALASTAVLETADVEVAVQETGTAQVSISYAVTADGPVTDVGFTALTFQGRTVSEVEVRTAQGQPLPTSTDVDGLRTSVTATLAEPLDAGAVQELVVAYEVPGAALLDGDDLDSQVPVLAIDVPPASASQGVFTAAVTLPSGYSYVEGFPSNPESVETIDGDTVIRYDVPVAAALIGTTATTGPVPFLTTARVAEGVLLVVLIVGGAAFWAHLRRSHSDVPDDPTTPSTPARLSEGSH